MIVPSKAIVDHKTRVYIHFFSYFIMFITFQEIQKIVVFEGAFEKIFDIIKEEGGSEGGVVVQVVFYDNFLLLLHKSFSRCILLH